METLQPSNVWYMFGEICSIPHGSGNEKEIALYIKDILAANYQSAIDEKGNVIVYIPATPGFESAPIVVSQGHLDMVCEKNSDKDHDFIQDPIELVKLGNWLRANGTSLGADNGIGGAAMLAALLEERSFNHGPLELLFTVEEETGFFGAVALDPSYIKGRIFLNLDSEEESHLFIGCAGGGRVNGVFQPVYEQPTDDLLKYQIKVSGLVGGHSGLKIHEGNANAIKVAAETLNHLVHFDPRIISLSGGDKMNAIPREAEVTFMVSNSMASDFLEKFQILIEDILPLKYANEPSMVVTLTPLKKENEDVFMHPQSQQLFVKMLDELPHGVYSYEDNDSKMVQSSNNVGVINSDNGVITVTCMYRGSVEGKMDELSQLISGIFERHGADVEEIGRYAAWQPDFDSGILRNCKLVYNSVFDKDPVVTTVHAGLECAVFYTMFPGAELISFGPTMTGVHSPDEQLDIESVDKFYKFLISLLNFYAQVEK